MKRYFSSLFFFLAISLFHAQTVEQLFDLMELEKDSLSKLISQYETDITDLNTSFDSEIELKEKSNINALKLINDKYTVLKVELEKKLKKKLVESNFYDNKISSNVDNYNAKSKEFESLYGEKKSISLILKHIYPYPDTKTIFNKINNDCCKDFKIDRNAQIKYYELLNTFDLLYKKSDGLIEEAKTVKFLNKKLLKRKGEYYNFDKDPLFYSEFDEKNGYNNNLQIDKKTPQKTGTILTGTISLNINTDKVLGQIENKNITLDQNDLTQIILISNDHKKTKIDALLNEYEIYFLRDKEKEDYIYSLTGIDKNYFKLRNEIKLLDSNISQLKLNHDTIKNKISDLEKKLKKNNDDNVLDISNCKQRHAQIIDSISKSKKNNDVKLHNKILVLKDSINSKDSLLKEIVKNEYKQPLCSSIEAIALCNNKSIPKNYNGVWKCCKGDKTVSYGHVKNGKKHGVQKSWWTNGQIKEKIFFENGKKQNAFKKYNKDGELRYIVSYVEGVKNGVEKKWWDNGNLKESSYHSNGKKDGVFKKFDENGEIIYVVDYVEGIKDGMEKSWWDNGNLKVKFLYQNGKKDGFCYEWFENGNMKYEKVYSNGLLSGYYNVYHENGVIKKRALYSEGKIYGNPKCYDKNFNLIRCH